MAAGRCTTSASTASTPRATCSAPSRRRSRRCRSTAASRRLPRSTRRRPRRCASATNASRRSSPASMPPTSPRTASSARRAISMPTRPTSTPKGSSTRLTIDGKTTRKAIGKRDQFAPELLYFSDCILKDREPEPSGEEGLQDVRIVQALYESARSGRPVALRRSRSDAADGAPADHAARREEAAAHQGAERQRRLTDSPTGSAFACRGRCD